MTGGNWLEYVRAGDCALNDICVMDRSCPFYQTCKKAGEIELDGPTHVVPLVSIPGRLDDLDYTAVLEVLKGERTVGMPLPYRHRCLACFLVSLLPGHYRCSHGRLGCTRCEFD